MGVTGNKFCVCHSRSLSLFWLGLDLEGQRPRDAAAILPTHGAQVDIVEMRRSNPGDPFEPGDPAMLGRSSTMGLFSYWAKRLPLLSTFIWVSTTCHSEKKKNLDKTLLTKKQFFSLKTWLK